VLIDCQGTGDSLMSTPTLDNLILYLGLQLANVQILNLKSVLQTNDLERIDVSCWYRLYLWWSLKETQKFLKAVVRARV